MLRGGWCPLMQLHVTTSASHYSGHTNRYYKCTGDRAGVVPTGALAPVRVRPSEKERFSLSGSDHGDVRQRRYFTSEGNRRCCLRIHARALEDIVSRAGDPKPTWIDILHGSAAASSAFIFERKSHQSGSLTSVRPLLASWPGSASGPSPLAAHPSRSWPAPPRQRPLPSGLPSPAWAL